ncbi:AAA family ATPase [Burkholderiaceae bacterium UC74_6]
MIDRIALHELRCRMSYFPSVVLLGPRQVGKSTLARTFTAGQREAIVLDMERPADRAQLAEPELFLSRHRDKLVVLDEVQLIAFTAATPPQTPCT